MIKSSEDLIKDINDNNKHMVSDYHKYIKIFNENFLNYWVG